MGRCSLQLYGTMLTAVRKASIHQAREHVSPSLLITCIKLTSNNAGNQLVEIKYMFPVALHIVSRRIMNLPLALHQPDGWLVPDGTRPPCFTGEPISLKAGESCRRKEQVVVCRSLRLVTS